MCAHIIVHTILPPSQVILWMETCGKPKWLPLDFGYHDVMRTDHTGFSARCFATRSRSSAFCLKIDWRSWKTVQQHLLDLSFHWLWVGLIVYHWELSTVCGEDLCACARACVCACVCAWSCVRVCVCVCVCVLCVSPLPWSIRMSLFKYNFSSCKVSFFIRRWKGVVTFSFVIRFDIRNAPDTQAQLWSKFKFQNIVEHNFQQKTSLSVQISISCYVFRRKSQK